jgi:geranylgeranyl diphosphate synthase type I
MAADKTGALLACAASIGAVLADADEPTVAALAAFGAHLGLAFQAVDDLLGIWGVPEVTGKPVGADLRQGKSTLPVTAALAAGGPAAKRLAGLLGQGGPATEEEVTLAAALIEEAGGRAWTVAEAAGQLDLALEELDRVEVPPLTRAELDGLARFVTSREL